MTPGISPGMPKSHASQRLRRYTIGLLASGLLASALFAGGSGASAAPKKKKAPTVSVMTRNLYLGADLGPAIAAQSAGDFIKVNGGILRQVDASNFPVRAKGLAKEILSKKPDLVGLQEAALWRTGDANFAPALGGEKTATTVRYDFLQLLLDQLNSKGRTYRLGISQDEFDFEAPADFDNDPSTGAATLGGEINGRLTMRDAILVRVGSGVKVRSPKAGHFQHIYTPKVGGTVDVPVTRGYVYLDAKVRNSPWFRFVDTHLESFDDETQVPSIRAQQAGELTAAGGPAQSKLPVILLGDLNSNVPGVKPGDDQAYRALLKAGFRERATSKPLGCCIESSYDLTTGSASDFDHKVDHITTNDPKHIKLVSSAVTGRSMQNGYWDSDHAGLFSKLKFQR